MQCYGAFTVLPIKGIKGIAGQNGQIHLKHIALDHIF